MIVLIIVIILLLIGLLYVNYKVDKLKDTFIEHLNTESEFIEEITKTTGAIIERITKDEKS